MEIRLDQTRLARAKLMLGAIDSGFPKAFSRALNSTTAGVRTDLVELVRTDYNYKATAIRKRISIRRATYQYLSAAVVSSGKEVHLTDITGTRQVKSGVSVDVKKSTGRHIIPRAFINQSRVSGKSIVFRRRVVGGKMVGRTPIDPRTAPHPENIYNTPENWQRIQDKADARLEKNFSKEVDVVLKGIA